MRFVNLKNDLKTDDYTRTLALDLQMTLLYYHSTESPTVNIPNSKPSGQTSWSSTSLASLPQCSVLVCYHPHSSDVGVHQSLSSLTSLSFTFTPSVSSCNFATLSALLLF